MSRPQGRLSGGGLSRRAFAQLLGVGASAAWMGAIVARGGEAQREFLAPPLAGRAGGELTLAKLLPKDPENLILLNSNENPYGASPAALEAMMESRSYAMRYPDYYADLAQEKIAAHHGVEPEMVVLTCGSTELLKIAAQGFLGPGRRLVMAEPTFEDIGYYGRQTGAEVVTVPLTADYRHDLEAMARAAQERPGLVYICNPNNPTGTVVSKAAIEKFLGQVPGQSVVLVDEAYHHFADEGGYGTMMDAAKQGRNVVVSRTFSKIYGMAGLRLGYGVARRELVQVMRSQRVISSGNVVACAAALASLDDAQWEERNREWNRRVRDSLGTDMKERGHSVIPSQANFVCVHVGRPVRPVIAAFRERGISIGRRFAGLPEHIRISLGSPEEMEKFVAAFDEVMAEAPASLDPRRGSRDKPVQA